MSVKACRRAAWVFLFVLLPGGALFPEISLADHHNVLAAGAFQCSDNPSVAVVNLQLEDAGENLWTNCIALTFQDSTGATTGVFPVTSDPPDGAGFIVRAGSSALSALAGAPVLHLVFDSTLLGSPGGQSCYIGSGVGSHPSGAGCRDINLCQALTQVVCGCDGVPGTADDGVVCGGGPVCGDGVIEAGEQCDDGNNLPGDCCSASCSFETGSCDDGVFCNGTDSCSAGSCVVHDGVVCPAVECGDTCNEALQACADPAGTACTDDGNSCSDDVCDGAGACSHPSVADQTPCDDGVACTTVDTCVAGVCTGVGAPNDATCDGIDEDCDGFFDEDFVGASATCGTGACTASGVESCVGGAIEITCTPGTPAADDAICDGLDDDCDGVADEDFAAQATSCGVGVCAATGVQTCAAGILGDTCAPTTPAADDATCDGIDEDCDGLFDEDFVGASATCGIGACAASGVESCVGGAVEGTCTPGTPAADDATCDGVDNDCDGSADEDYASMATSCGVGACAASGLTSCVDGAVQGLCSAGAPAADDAICDGIDEDCDGLFDEDFVGGSATCGIGACAASGVESCVGGAVEGTCTPGTPAADDATCDGVDNDCDGELDEDFTECEDGDDCTEDTCGPGGVCESVLLDGIPCENGDPCTINDTCSSGVCVPGTNRFCNDANPCTDDACLTGGCVYSANSAACDDGDPCTLVDSCSAAVCVGSGADDCDDQNDCTADSCESGNGCVYEVTGGSCEDGDFCTVTDACTDGQCVAGDARELGEVFIKAITKDGAAKDKLLVKAELSLAGIESTPDQGFVLALSDENFEPMYLSTLPPGAFSSNSSGSSFKFRDKTGSVEGGNKLALVKVRYNYKTGTMKVKAKMKGTDIQALSGRSAVTASLALGDPATTGDCLRALSLPCYPKSYSVNLCR
jgi:hypothetical protein